MTIPRSTHPRGKSLVNTGIIHRDTVTIMWCVVGAFAFALAGVRALEFAKSSDLARRELIAGLKRSPLRRL